MANKVIVVRSKPVIRVAKTVKQGMAGAVDYDAVFRITNLLSELDTPTKKAAARSNLELQYIDCGTFN